MKSAIYLQYYWERRDEMQVVVHEEKKLEKARVEIFCREIDEKVQKIERFIRQLSVMITAASDGRSCRISADDILYIESVDRRTFFYTTEEVYESKEPLYQLENTLLRTGITRISKNCLLNIDKLKSIAPFTNHRFEAVLVNGEKILISRNYIDNLKKKLEG